MGMLVEGRWRERWREPERADGRFERAPARFRGRVEHDPDAEHPAEPGRYHLYVSLACPWSHRAVLARAILGLEEVVGLSVVDPRPDEEGWRFSTGPGCVPDPHLNASYLHELYTASDRRYTGRVTVPVLWDAKRRTIVSNESADIVRMLGAAFVRWRRGEADPYPEDRREDVDEMNGFVHETVNETVYRAGFATTQEAYDDAVGTLFASLDSLEGRLNRMRFLAGDRPTEPDWRLLATAVRFDLVYYGLFKCNVRHWWDYPKLWAHTRALLGVAGVLETVRVDHIKEHYWRTHTDLHAAGIVPAGPEIDFAREPAGV